ncbi:putative phage tail protein [Rummeliibacillus sp. NPDC094406]|uniref:putative phage tail protein n=1 Tax=Rummeliibacillus sp. NPDC094406 TaxID=3364511 RepID=UPI0038205243
MQAIQESEWGKVNVFAWGDLTPHQWECFRSALMEVMSEMTINPVLLEQSGSINEVLTELNAKGVRVDYSPAVMQTVAEMIVDIVVSKRDYKTDMMKHLPLYERKSIISNKVLPAYDRELRNCEQLLDVAERNIFLDTAIESLSIFERDLGIQFNKSLSYDQRREQIASRNRASFDQTTEATIKSVAAAYSNGEVEINSTNIPGVYEIKFVGTIGIPNNMVGLQSALEIIMPAHLDWKFSFIYNTWHIWKDKTWGGVRDKNWNDLRIWDEVS